MGWGRGQGQGGNEVGTVTVHCKANEAEPLEHDKQLKDLESRYEASCPLLTVMVSKRCKPGFAALVLLYCAGKFLPQLWSICLLPNFWDNNWILLQAPP